MQFKDGEVTLSDGVTSFIHLDDAVEVSIQAMNFDTVTQHIGPYERFLFQVQPRHLP
jgi:hypothetical protein